MKSKTLIALMTTILSTTSFAEIHTSLKNAGFSENHAPLSVLLNNEALNATNALSTEDLAYAFNNSENLQLTAMNEQEMQNTQGAWSMHSAMYSAALGATSANYGYLTGAIASGEYNVGGHLSAIVGGAAFGAISPVSSLNNAVLTNGATYSIAALGTYYSSLFETIEF